MDIKLNLEADTINIRQNTGLTHKQCQALDLLIEHKTSKQIARELGISPNTVDQRLNFARQKLNVNGRSELAVRYREMKAICGKTTYEKTRIDAPAIPLENIDGSESMIEVASQSPNSSSWDDGVKRFSNYQVTPKMFEGNRGKIVRVAAIVAIATGILVLLLVGLAVFSSLSNLFAD